MTTSDRPAFYTVREAAALLRVGPSTLYRSIRENSFPAVRLRTRYVVPSKVIDQLIEEVVNGGGCVDQLGEPADVPWPWPRRAPFPCADCLLAHVTQPPGELSLAPPPKRPLAPDDLTELAHAPHHTQ